MGGAKSQTVKTGPIDVSQARVKGSRSEIYVFQMVFRVPRPWGAEQKTILGVEGGGKTNNIKTHLKICLIRAPGVKHMISM